MKLSSVVLVSAATLAFSGSLFAQSGPPIATLTPCNNAVYECDNLLQPPVATDDVVHKISGTLHKREIYKANERPKALTFVYVVRENAPVSVQRPTEFIVAPQSIGPGWMYITK